MRQNEIKITDLIEKENIKGDPSFGYWNDSDKESTKAFNVEIGFKKLESSTHLTDVHKQLNLCIDSSSISEDQQTILSLGSGTCWLESWWLKNKQPSHLTAVDFSKHRIHKLAPLTLKHYGHNYPVELIRGDFLNLGLEKNSFDIILLSQAFHHSQSPIELLEEINRMAKNGAKILIIGEHYFNLFDHLKQAIKHFIKLAINYKNYRKDRSFFPKYSDLFPPHLEQGDKHYSKAEYMEMFEKAGKYHIEHIINKKEKIQAYVLTIQKP